MEYHFHGHDPSTHLIVPVGQSIYDPAVFGTYDLRSQQVVQKTDAIEGSFSLDQLPRSNLGGFAFERDRYRVALSWLPRGSGICLDACSANPRMDVRQSVTAAGYEYLPIDIAASSGVQQEDLTQLSFEDGTVSCVLSVDTLEHIPDYEAAIGEMFRVLKTGGGAIIHVPCYYFDRPTGEPIRPGVDPWGHVRYHSARELLAKYHAAGFVNLRTTFLFDYGAVLSALVKP